MLDRLRRCLYSAGANASCSNQSETSIAAHDIWKFQTELWSIEVLALISALGITIHNGPLPMITTHCYVITALQCIRADICRSYDKCFMNYGIMSAANLSLQCFDAVGWATAGTSGLWSLWSAAPAPTIPKILLFGDRPNLDNSGKIRL